MRVICILVVAIIFINSIIIKPHLYNIQAVFSGFFLIIMIAACSGWNGMKVANDMAYILIMFGVLSFSVGYFFAGLVIPKCKKSSLVTLNENVLYILYIICCISLWGNYIVIFQNIRNGIGLGEIYVIVAKTVSGDETSLSNLLSSNVQRMQQYIAYPLLYLLVPTLIGLFRERHNKKYLIMSVFLVSVRLMYDLRKTILVMLACWIFLIYFLDEKKKFTLIKIIRITKENKDKKNKRAFVICIVSIFVIFMVASISRAAYQGKKYSIFENLYYYYAGCVSYLSYRLDRIGKIKYTYGLTSLRGLFAPFFGLIEILGLKNPNIFLNATDNINSLHAISINVGNGRMMNTYATCFFQFYQDGGWIGVFIGSFFYGYYSNYISKNFCYEGELRWRIKLAYFIGTFILYSMAHFNGCVICYVWPLALERVLYKRKLKISI